MGLKPREVAMLVCCSVLLFLSAGLEIRRRSAVRAAMEAVAHLERVEAAARAWQAESGTMESILERERLERQALWEQHDALRFSYDSIIYHSTHHARPRPPRTAPALRESILRATREQ